MRKAIQCAVAIWSKVIYFHYVASFYAEDKLPNKSLISSLRHLSKKIFPTDQSQVKLLCLSDRKIAKMKTNII